MQVLATFFRAVIVTLDRHLRSLAACCQFDAIVAVHGVARLCLGDEYGRKQGGWRGNSHRVYG